MADSRIKQIIDKFSEHIIELTDITYVADQIGVNVSHKLYGELAYNEGAVKRATVGKVFYQDVMTMVIVNGESLEPIRKALEIMLLMYMLNGDKLAELQALSVHDIVPIRFFYPTKRQGAGNPWGHIVYEITLRIQG